VILKSTEQPSSSLFYLVYYSSLILMVGLSGNDLQLYDYSFIRDKSWFCYSSESSDILRESYVWSSLLCSSLSIQF